MIVPALVPWGALTLLLSGTSVIASLGEAFGTNNAPYSKFSHGKPAQRKLPSRLGMLCIYAGGLLVSGVGVVKLAIMSSQDKDWRSFSSNLLRYNRPGLVAVMYFLHFLKRECEVLFLHKYSGGIDVGTVTTISAVYTIFTAINLRFLSTTPLQVFATPAVLDLPVVGSVPMAVAFGSTMYILGELGNFYHHWLLARLRKEGDRQYKVPQGGLFPYITCPHYLFELIAFYGIAVTGQHLVLLEDAVRMTFYLGSRSIATREWYRKKVEGYPLERKCLVPFVF